jgi:hypothetical protein
MLSPEDLVQITEAISAAGLLLFAVIFKRELPSDEQSRFAEGTRKLLLLSAPGTLDAAGEQLQQNRELLRMLSPLGYLAGLVTHLVQRGRELAPRGKPREVFVQPPVSSVPMNERPEVWKPGHVQEPTATGVKPESQQPRNPANNPPPGVEFGQRRMPRLPTFTGRPMEPQRQ